MCNNNKYCARCFTTLLKNRPIEEILSAVISIPAALLLALRVEYSNLAYVLFIPGSVFALICFIRSKQSWFFVQNVVYLIINLVGLYNWVLT